MRTTLTLDDDVIDKAKAVAAKRCLTFRAVVNEALRIGLQEVGKPATRRPCRTEPHAKAILGLSHFLEQARPLTRCDR